MILIGTSGYSFSDWVGPFYPQATPTGRMLDYYSRKFDVTEVNATYYAIPPARTFESMVARTPARFRFIVKAHQSMTHSRDCDDATYARFLNAVRPLVDAGKMSGYLAQFPYGFKFNRPNLDYISALRDRLNAPLFVEFRHISWIRDSVFIALEAEKIGFCMVDEPHLPNLVPKVAVATTQTAYLRFHGRNKDDWWHPRKGSDRYNYKYADGELSEWLPDIRKLEKKCKSLLVFFNNCHHGSAPLDAMRMMELLGMEVPPGPGQVMLEL